MSEPVWPLDLPQRPLRDGYKEGGRQTLLRTQMDAGPAKTRRRATAGVRRIAARYAMSEEQLGRFLDFFEHDLADGAVPVWMPHPRTGETVRVSLAASEPEWTPLGTGPRWAVALQLEVLP